MGRRPASDLNTGMTFDNNWLVDTYVKTYDPPHRMEYILM